MTSDEPGKPEPIELSPQVVRTAGILLIAIVAVEYGGIFMFAIHRSKREFTGFQKASFRAGHAHAGVLLILSLIALLYVDSLRLSGFSGLVGRSAIPLAAILMPAGFFLGAIGKGRTTPNPWMNLVYLGALSLTAGVLVIGVSLLTS